MTNRWIEEPGTPNPGDAPAEEPGVTLWRSALNNYGIASLAVLVTLRATLPAERAGAAMTVVALLLAVGTLTLLIRRPPTRWTWAVSLGLVPPAVCGVSLWAAGHGAPAYFAILGAPVAAASALLEVPALVTAWGAGVIVCTWAVSLESGWMVGVANGLLFAVAHGMVGYIVYGKSRRRRDARLRLLERRVNDIELVLRLDDLVVVEANDRAIEAYGYPREALVGMHIDRIRAIDHEQMRRQFARAGTEADYIYETEHRRADASTFPVETSSRRFVSRGVPYLHILARDITARRAAAETLHRAQAALVASERRLREAERIARAGHWEWRFDTGDHSWSENLYDLLQVDPSRGTPPPDTVRSMLSPAERDDFDRYMAELHAGRTARLRFKAGTTPPLVFESRAEPIFGEDGRVIGGRGLLVDMTAQVEREVALGAARDAAIEAARSKSAFLAAMSHEIRTPMNGVLGMMELLHQTALTPEQDDLVRTATSSGETLLFLINDILDFSKLDAGRVELHPAPFEVRRAIGESVAIVRERAKEKDLDIAVSIAAGVPAWLHGDAMRFRQVLLNLLSNAVKFTPAGRVHLRALVDAEHRLRIEVADTGIGLTPEQQGRLFRPFTQADSSIAPRYGGTGLGLAISQQLVTLMGGQIGVESVPGVGSTFWFTAAMPVSARPGDTAPDAAAFEVEVPVEPLDVLVVDDNPVNRKVAERMLQRLGHVTTSVADGSEAVEAVRAHRYDVVLMDCQMPTMDGFEATERIRAEHADAPPVLAVTASALDEDRAHCLRCGMSAVLIKPYKLETLAAMLAEHGRPTHTTA